MLKEKKKLSDLEHRTLALLRKAGLEGASFLVLVSGGVDSVVAFHLLWRLRKVARLKIRVGHVHHGPLSGRQGQFRNQSWRATEHLAAERDVAFVSNASLERKSWKWNHLPPAMNSEAEWRIFRRECWRSWRAADEWVVTGHHADDLLETRLIRLIRGTGAGGLRSMATLQKPIFRPLLRVSRAEILDYAHSENLQWCEDPSNLEVSKLRNFLRHDWLPRLEQHRKGSTANLTRSLELLAKSAPKPTPALISAAHDGELDWSQVLAEHFREQGVETYSGRHIEELLKRIANRKAMEFELLGRRWRWDGQKLSWSLVSPS